MNNIPIRAAVAADPGPRELLEDVPMTDQIVTAAGLYLQIAIVCDGVGGAKSGERAAYIAATEAIESMRRNRDHIVPRMMIQAVKDANHKVFYDQTSGKATMAMIVVHFDGQSPYGRLYIASVGDSSIFLVRQGEVKRLNTDHNVANELVMNGKASPQEAYAMKNAYHLTRAMGVAEDVDVDIGFYYNAPSADAARQRGKVGIVVEQGDTIFACSDGLTDLDQQGQPYVRPEEFVEHAMEDNPDRTAKMYISYALRRGTTDNVSVALLFVDSPKRKAALDSGGRFRLPMKYAIPGITLLLVAILAAIFVFMQQREEADETKEELQAVQNEIQAATSRFLTIEAYTDTPTPTFTPSPTPTATSTPTLTPTPLPPLRPGQAGYLIDMLGNSVVVNEAEMIQADEESMYVSVGNANADRFGYFYFSPDTTGQLLSVTDDTIEFYMLSGGDVFIQTRGYQGRGVEIEMEDLPRARFYVRGSCMSVYQRADTVTVGCYSGTCSYALERGVSPTILPEGRQFSFQLDEISNDLANFAIDQEDAIRYESLLAQFSAPGAPQCVTGYVPTPTPTPSPTRRAPTRTPTATATADQDGDGIPDHEDNCPTLRGNPQFGGCPTPDTDGDGLNDLQDGCPNEAGPAEENGCPRPDNDNDGINNNDDNCPGTSNPDQTDTDGDGRGDACDPTPNGDDDDDGVDNSTDNCPNDVNPKQIDTDGDGQGDVCDPTPNGDTDGDGVDNSVDNCPNTSNPNQTDTDGDGVGDACDSTPTGDNDADGVDNATDNCPDDSNPNQTDTDGDGIGDVCDSTPNGDSDGDGIDNAADNCPDTSNPNQTDTDGDGQGNACDPTPNGDTDGDGVDNATDNCPNTANPNQTDTDGDGQGDACDPTPNGDDDDGDGVPNSSDNCPGTSNPSQTDTDGDGTGDACDPTPNGDSDGDGVDNNSDNCPGTSNPSQTDTDGDGTGDACDPTPNGDTDGDGVDNNSDNCPGTSNPDQTDTDNDGLGNACDPTPNGDNDGDGVDNAADNCPAVANADQTDTDNDGLGNACDSTPNGDSDGDGVDNNTDNCPNDANPGQEDADEDGIGDACDTPDPPTEEPTPEE